MLEIIDTQYQICFLLLKRAVSYKLITQKNDIIILHL